MGNLTQLATVKARLRVTDSVDDTLITNAIKGLSARISRMCDRVFDRTVGATMEFGGDEQAVPAKCYPVESVAGFELKTTEAEGWVAVTSCDWLVKERSVIALLTPLGAKTQIARVTYTGGYVLPGGTVGGGQTALEDDLEQAVVEQVAYWYQNRDRLGLTSVSGEGGSIQQFAKLDLLPSVQAVVESYERYRW